MRKALEDDDDGVCIPKNGIDGTFDWIHQTFELKTDPESNDRCLSYIYLRLSGTNGTAWFDGVELGSCDSLATPHVHPVPRNLAKPGRHELKIVVDNSCFYGFSRQGHSYGPNMQAVWNGVLGRIEIRRAHPLRAAKVFAGCAAISLRMKSMTARMGFAFSP